MITVTEQELVDALRVAVEQQTTPEDNGALTTAELCNKLGYGRKKVRRILRESIEAGVVEHTTVYRKDLVGVVGPRHAYRLIGAVDERTRRQVVGTGSQV